MSNYTPSKFKSLGFPVRIVDILEKNNHKHPFDVEASVIYSVIEGSDVIVQAPKEEGRLEALVMSVAAVMLRNSKGSGKDAMVVVPTIEDAEELEEVFHRLLGKDVLSVAVITDESKGVHYSVRVTIGTPKRLAMLVEEGQIGVKRLDFLAIEGIDMIVANKQVGLIDDLTFWMHNDKRITAVFAEEMDAEVAHAASRLMGDNCERIVTKTFKGLRQYCLTAFEEDEASTLYQLSRKVGSGRVVVYCKTTEIASSVADSLAQASTRDGLDVADRMHSIVTMTSSMSSVDCTEACELFKTGDARILVFDEKTMGGYEFPPIALSVIYTESGLEGPDIKTSYKACLGRSAYGKKKLATSTVVHFRKDTPKVYVNALEEENNTKIELVDNVDAIQLK
ncbi:hypothetical protein BGX33_006322 [Mortierella sp. NVP41]|nr:hypothetical protein BGX33_006322 [Mortierella sp. NVP41]